MRAGDPPIFPAPEICAYLRSVLAHRSPTISSSSTSSQRWERQARVYDYNARLYEPHTARFFTHDPAREFRNQYAYVLWKPVRMVDPSFVPEIDMSLTFSLTTHGSEI